MVTKAYPRMFAGLTNVDQAWTETQTGPRWALTGGAAYFALSSGNPFMNWDSNDYSLYDITANSLNLLIGGTTRHTVSATGMTLGGDFFPITTETHDLGSPTFEWDNLYSQNAVTVSDERRKIDLGVIDGQQALAFIDALDPRLFRFRDTVIPERSETVMVEAIDADGNRHTVPKTVVHPERIVPHSRPHSGFFAQQVKGAMDRAGIEDCGVYAYDPETDTHELRLFEMLAWLTAGMKALMERAPVTLDAELSRAVEPDLFDQPDPRDEALAAAEAELAALRARVAELEQAPLLPAPDAKASEPEAPIDPKDAETIIDGFAGELRTSRDTAEGTMRSMDPPDRRRLFSILNTELGRLKNQEALLGKSIPRRADVEELIGILAKVGEA